MEAALRLGSIDVAALGIATAVSLISFFLARDVVRPLPPHLVTAKSLVHQGLVKKLPFRFGADSRFHFFREIALADPGATIAFKFLTVERILIQDADDIDYVLNRNASNFVKSKNFAIFARALGNGLVTIFDDEMHSRHRRLVSPAFSPVSLRRISNDVIRDHAHTMLGEFLAEISAPNESSTTSSSSPQADAFADVVVKDIIHRTALNIIAEAAFHTTDEKDTNEVNRLFQMIISDLWHPMHLTSIGRALSPKLRRIDRLKEEADEFINRTAKRIREEGIIVTEGTGRTIIDYLLQSSELTLNDIRDHSITFMSAGFETSSNSLQWIIALLAKHPECQQRLFEELSLVMTLGSTPEIDNLRTCQFLDAVIREGMRLRPVVTVVPRDSLVDDVLPSTKAVIPAGSTVLTSFLALHFNKSVYGQDAEEFRPERWLDPALRSRAEERYFLPFGLGKRNCIGKEFAWNEISILLAVMARNFQWSFPPMLGADFLPRADNHFLNVPEKFAVRLSRRLV